MIPNAGRRGSFSAFVKTRNSINSAASGITTPSPARATPWQRMIHCDALLGYSIKTVCLAIVPFVGFLAGIDWLEIRDSVPQTSPVFHFLTPSL